VRRLDEQTVCTITIYGHSNGSVTIHRQHRDTQSCVYDGTHY
jgi:hypothetical protein